LTKAAALARTPEDRPMSAEVFERLCALIHQHSRIHLTASKLNMLSSRLGKRRRELGLSSWDDYLAWLTQQGPPEMDLLIDLVATNHTHFFREAIQFEIFKFCLKCWVLLMFLKLVKSAVFCYFCVFLCFFACF
jgi:hypothetical protein